MTATSDGRREGTSAAQHEAPAAIMLPTDKGTLVARIATDADEPALRRLFSSITMDADLSLQVRRDPDFFALYRMQDDAWETWVCELEGELVALGTVMARDGYLDGERCRVGYLGDLRLDPSVRGGEILRTIYGPVLDGFADRHGVDVFYTAVIASNARAVRALTGERAASMGVPTYHLLERFRIRAVQTIAARRPPRAARRTWRVRMATDADVPAVAALLDRDARTRAFGIPMDADLLRHGLDRWPGLDITQFHLLERRDTGELVGCIAPWDATPVKQTWVTAYRGSMRWVRRGYNTAATLMRAPRLPRPGSPMRYAYATHHAVIEADHAAHRLLLHHAWQSVRAAGRGDVFLSCRVPLGDPSEAAYIGFVTTDLPAHLYAVVARGAELPSSLRDVERTGFEMALV